MSMYRTLVHGKIHRARVTGADLHYIGSITIDALLLEAAGILPFERVQMVDVTNGARLETYTIAGEPGSGVVQLNGAAAHLVTVGDLVIIMAYAQVDEPMVGWAPTVVFVDGYNRIAHVQPLPNCGLEGTSLSGDVVSQPMPEVEAREKTSTDGA